MEISNYWRITVPYFCVPLPKKTFQRILYNIFHIFLSKNNLTSPKQSGFNPGDSCIKKLLWITHELYLNHLSMIVMFETHLKSLSRYGIKVSYNN